MGFANNCPVCDSEDFEIEDSSVLDDCLINSCVCPDCHSTWNEMWAFVRNDNIVNRGQNNP